MILVSALLFWLVPLAVLLAGALGVHEARLLPAAAAATGLSAPFWTLISHGMEIPLAYGLGYPLGSAMTLYIVGRSIWRGGRRVEWRGQVYGTDGGRGRDDVGPGGQN